MRRLVIAVALWAALLVPIARGAESGEGEEAPPADETTGSATASEAAEDAEEAGAEAEETEPATEETEAEAEEEGEPGYFSEYAGSVRTRALTGLNGILTAPADPVMATVDPPKALEKGGYVKRPLGLGSGFLQMVYRTCMGTVDLSLALIPELPVVSPVPRYKLIPGFTHDDE